MLHYLLPNSTGNAQRAKEEPFVYADTGMNLLLGQLESMGLKKNKMQVKIAGGASVLKIETKGFDIGKRNYLAIRKILWKYGMFIDAEDVGGSSPSTLHMRIDNGDVTITTKGFKKNL